MAASPYTKMSDVMYNVEYQLGQIPVLIPLQALITAYRVANTALSDIDMTSDDILAILKALTGCTVATGITANCYPRGEATFLCFDLDGNPLP